jgi:hypothetical protein
VRHDKLAGIAEGLELSKVFLAKSAESAFLEMGLAADPYEPQRDILNSHHKILAFFGANRCLSMNSEVLMAKDFTKPLRDVVRGDQVVAFDFTTKDFVEATVNGVYFNGAQTLHRFKHSEGLLDCTRAHKVLAVAPKTGRLHMVRVMRAVKEQFPVIVRNANGCPILSRIDYLEELDCEPTMDLGVDHPDHAFVANGIVVSNSGKTHTGVVKMAWDATGLYPSWYKGPRTNRGIDAWVLGDTNENTRDTAQRKLFGPDPNRPGWTDKPAQEGLIARKYIIGEPSKKTPAGCFDTVRVVHVPSDTISTITFKSHKMGRQSLASWHGDRVLIDEECDKDILEEMVARVMDNKGQIFIALCPIDGMTPTVKFLLTAPSDLVKVCYLTHADATHLDPKEKENIRRMYASNPAMMIARTEGKATSNSGLIFPFETSQILYDPAKISISSQWKYMGGLDVGWRHPTAATAVAWDPLSDVAYCYATYEQAERPYLYHHAQLQAWGANMTFMIDRASNQANQAEGTRILEELWKLAHGENYLDIPEEIRKYIQADKAFHTGMDTMWHRFNSKRLLISKNLRSLIEQYESYAWNKDGTGPRDETDEIRYDIITSLRYGLSGMATHAHRLDCTPPWLDGEFDGSIDIKDWKPYRAGR